MQQVIDAVQNRATRPLASHIPLDNAFEVIEVYEGSIAHAAGLTAGMIYIADPMDIATSDYTNLEIFTKNEPMDSRFVDASKRQEILLSTERFPFGLDMLSTTERVCRMIREGNALSTDAMSRIHCGEQLDFAEIIDALTARGASASLGSSLLKSVRAFASGERDDLDERVENIILAAWAAQNGDLERATSLLPDSDDGSVRCHGGVLTSIYFYAVALCVELSGGSTVDVTGLLEVALDYTDDSLLIRRKLTAVSGRATMPSARTPHPFQSQYTLPMHDPLHGALPHDCRQVGLDATLRTLAKWEFVIVIMLGDYRCNGYYSREMQTLAALWPMLGKHFPHVHILNCAAPEDDDFNDWWMDGEIMAREAGVPVTLLYDYGNEVALAVNTESSPHISIIDRDGIVVNKDTSGIEEGLWSALRHCATATHPAPKPVLPDAPTPAAMPEPEPAMAHAIAAEPVAEKPKKKRRFGRPAPGFTL